MALVPEGQDIAPESKDVQAIYDSFFSFSQTISATPSSAQIIFDSIKLPDFFSNGKKVVFSKGRLCDIDKLEYYDGEVHEAIERAILYYQCYVFSISAFPERFENTPEYFIKEVDVIFLCIKRGWKDHSLLSTQHIAYRLKHINGISLIVRGVLLFFIFCTLTA